MWESKLDIDHASNSVALIYDIRMILNSATDDKVEWCQKVDTFVDQIDKFLKQTPDGPVPVEWEVVVAGLRVLVSQVTCVAIAQGGEGDLVAERARCDVLVGELRRRVSSDTLTLPGIADSTRQSLLQTGQCDSDELRAFLLATPLPILYWHRSKLDLPYQGAAEEPVATLRVPNKKG